MVGEFSDGVGKPPNSDKVGDDGGIIGGVAIVVAGGGRSWSVLAPSPLEEEWGLFKLTVRDKGLLFCHY